MRYPEKTFLGYTYIGWLNILIFQWLFFRLQGTVSNNGDTQWQLILPILPLTGWLTNYIPHKYKTINL